MDTGLLSLLIPTAGLSFVLFFFTKGKFSMFCLKVALMCTALGGVVLFFGLKKENVTIRRDANGNMIVHEGGTQVVIPPSPFSK